jgi:hypothetical protein
MPRYLFTPLLLLFIPVSLHAEPMACTAMWCQEGLTVNFTGKDWPEGKYQFEIQAGGTTTRCQGHLPFNGCEDHTTCDREGITIMESGCMLPDVEQSFAGIMMKTIPTAITLRVRHESGKKFEFSSPVARQCGYPNGKQCDKKECCSGVLNAPVIWR